VRRTTARLVLAMTLLLSACVGARPGLQSQLLDMADGYLEARNNLVTDQAGPRTDLPVAMTDAFRRRVEPDLEVLASRADGTYAYSETTLTVVSFDFDGRSATLVAQEHTRLAYVPVDPDTPPFSEYAWERTFQFVQAEDEAWLLSGDVWPTFGGGLPDTVVD
jgi:hypothetical protein